MKIDRNQLTYLVDESRRKFIELQPGVCLPGTFKALSESDRIAVCWLQGAIDVLAQAGYIDLKKATDLGGFVNLDLEFDLPDSSTMTEGYDSEVEKGGPETK